MSPFDCLIGTEITAVQHGRYQLQFVFDNVAHISIGNGVVFKSFPVTGEWVPDMPFVHDSHSLFNKVVTEVMPEYEGLFVRFEGGQEILFRARNDGYESFSFGTAEGLWVFRDSEDVVQFKRSK